MSSVWEMAERGAAFVTAAKLVAKALREAPPHLHGILRQECCNPDCGGTWGTGCYCCHGGRHHPALKRFEKALKELES